MSRPRTSKRAADPGRVPTTICFRVDPETARVLIERADRLGCSPHDVARDMIFSVLHEPDHRAAVLAALLGIQESTVKLRGDLATVAKALLTNAGKIDPNEADAWICEVFN